MAQTGHLRDFMVKDCNGADHTLSELMRPVTLIVNIDCKVGGTANSECRSLQEMYARLKDRGMEILAFPCDQFQYVTDQGERITAVDVRDDLMKRYNVTFPIMHKVNVNGEEAHPLFMFLQKRLSGFPTNSIKWDFTKFLIVNEEPIKRYSPTTMLSSIEADIVHTLGPERMPGLTGRMDTERV